MVAARSGGIPLQIRHGETGFLVPPADPEAAAEHMYQLFTDEKLYRRMSEAAKVSVSDEVSTVGMALR